jgi:hypothetical protein
MALLGQFIVRTNRYRTETMISKKGFRKEVGGFLQAAAGAAVLIGTAICATRWAAWAMAASDSGPRRGVPASLRPVNVKDFVVPRPGKRAAA